MVIPDPFEHVYYHGKLMDNKTMAFLMMMEHRLGYVLTIDQGCYNVGGVAASAGTHDGGGVIDLAPADYVNKVRVGANLGAFIWHRPALAGEWPEHIHFGIRNHGRLSPAAQAQQRDWDHDPPLDGLADHAPMTGYHPDTLIDFNYRASWKKLHAA